jgi:hypothetical protein
MLVAVVVEATQKILVLVALVLVDMETLMVVLLELLTEVLAVAEQVKVVAQ